VPDGGSSGMGGGSSGMGGGGSTGGGAATPAACVPGTSLGCACTDGRKGAQICNGQGRFDACVCADERLLRLRKGVLATWNGTVTTPWVKPYSVTMTFFADGHYSARCLQPNCVAMYYGSDADSAEKRYDIQDVRADDKGAGEITFWFNPGNTNGGQLRNIDLSVDGSSLAFDAWKGDYGPLHFALRR
jgi:hypothetical protein